jgi:hypothetical protein
MLRYVVLAHVTTQGEHEAHVVVVHIDGVGQCL